MQPQTLEQLRNEVEAEAATQSTQSQPNSDTAPAHRADPDDQDDNALNAQPNKPDPTATGDTQPRSATQSTTQDHDDDGRDKDAGDDGEDKTAQTETETEAWLSDEQASNDEKPRLFSSDDVRGARLKERAKTEKRLEQQHAEEITRLKAEMEALKSGAPIHPNQPGQAAPMPLLEHFDYDERRYAQAMQQWVAGTVQSQLQAVNQTSQQQNRLNQLNSEVDKHYERALKLAQQNGIRSDVYQQSDLNVRTALDEVMPGQGDAVADGLIAHLGEGSEKVFYYLGRNPTKLAELKNKLIQDRSGLKAAVFLGQLQASFKAPARKPSNAPPPARQITGDASPTPTATAMKKRYEKAEASGNVQAAYEARKAARAAGVDVSSW